MDKSAKIYVAGHRGLVGSALLRGLQKSGYTNLVFRTHTELDLTDTVATMRFFEQEKPEYVLLSAAKVGGILANNHYPAEFIYQNLMIQTNAIHAAWKYGIKRLLFLGSNCMYPKLAPQPIKEDALLAGLLEPTNRPYALAKIAGIEMCWSYNRQYGTRFLAAMPCNLYGPGDTYDPQASHVIPGLIYKFHAAMQANVKQVKLLGTGTPRREFLYSDDMAEACLFLMNLDDGALGGLLGNSEPPLVNIGTGADMTIREVAMIIKDITGFKGEVIFDASQPDGTPRKLLDMTRLNRLGWKARVSLEKGLMHTYEIYKASAA